MAGLRGNATTGNIKSSKVTGLRGNAYYTPEEEEKRKQAALNKVQVNDKKNTKPVIDNQSTNKPLINKLETSTPIKEPLVNKIKEPLANPLPNPMDSTVKSLYKAEDKKLPTINTEVRNPLAPERPQNNSGVNLGSTLVNTLVQVGKGIGDFAEGVIDTSLAVASSKYNPFMHLLYDGDIESGQRIADELIAQDGSEQLIDNLGYNKVLSTGKTIQQTLDDSSLVTSTNLGGQIARGIGAQLPSMMVGAGLGANAGLAAMFPQSYASGYESVIRNGGDRETATKYGLANATIELATEKMFSGLGGIIGKGALDDVVIDSLTKNISNSVFKTLSKWGLSSLGEGVEELAGNLLQPLAQKLTGASKEELSKLYANQNYLEDFVQGTLSAAVMQGITGLSGVNVDNTQTQQEVTEPAIDKPQIEVNETPSQQQTNQQDNTTSVTEEQQEVVTEDAQNVVQKQPEIETPVQSETQETVKEEVKQPVVKEKPKAKVETSKVETTQVNFDKIGETYKKYVMEQDQAKKQEYLNQALEDYTVYKNQGGTKSIQRLDIMMKQQTPKIETPKVTKPQTTPQTLNKEVVTDKNLDARKQMLTKKATTFERDISKYRTDAKQLNEWTNNTLKIYDKYVADGGETIQEYEDLRSRYNVQQTINSSDIKVNEPVQKETKGLNKTEPNKTKEKTSIDRVTTPETSKKLQESSDKALEEYEIACEMDDASIEVEEIQAIPDSEINAYWHENTTNTLEELKNSTDPSDKALYKELTTSKKLATKNAVKQVTSKLRNLFQNKQHAILLLDKSNKTTKGFDALKQKLSANTQGHYIVDHHQLDLNQQVIGEGVASIWKPIDKLDGDSRKIIYTYMMNQSDLARKIAQEKYGIDYADNIFPNKTIDDLQNEIKVMEKDYPGLTKTAKNINKKVQKFYRNQNSQSMIAGMLNTKVNVPEAFAREVLGLSDAYITNNTTNEGDVTVDNLDYLSKLNPWYQRISRDMGINPASSVYSKDGTVGVRGTKGLKEGSNIYAIEPLADSMALDAIQTRIAIRTNQLHQTLAEELKNIDMAQDVKVQDAYDKEGNFKFVVNNDGNHQMHMFVVDKNGNTKLKAIDIPEAIYDEIVNDNLLRNTLSSTKPIKAIKGVARVQRALQTTLSPAFQLSNAIMDAGGLVLNSEFPLTKVTKYMNRYLVDRARNSKYYKEYSSMKGDVYRGFDYNEGLSLKQGKFNKAMTSIEKISTMLEQNTRYAEYLCARNNGYSPAESFALSEKVTTDFANTGSVLKTLDLLGLTNFVGTGMAGFNRGFQTLIGNQVDAIKTITENKTLNLNKMNAYDQKTVKRSMRTLFRLTAAGISTSLLVDLIYDEEDKEMLEKIPQSIRDKNFIIPINDDQYIKIPKDRTVAAVTAIGDFINDPGISDADKRTVMSTLNFVWDRIGFNDLEQSSTFSTILNILKNEDYFGNEIRDEKETSKEQLKQSTEYALKQYGGFITQVTNYVMGKTDKVPVVDKLYGTTKSLNDSKSKYYDIINKYDGHKDPLLELKARYSKYIYKDIKEEEELLNAYKEQGSSKEVIKDQENKLRQLYNEIFEGVENEPEDLSVQGDMSVIMYNGYVYKYNEESGRYNKKR